jgi:hypothetical protein
LTTTLLESFLIISDHHAGYLGLSALVEQLASGSIQGKAGI